MPNLIKKLIYIDKVGDWFYNDSEKIFYLLGYNLVEVMLTSFALQLQCSKLDRVGLFSVHFRPNQIPGMRFTNLKTLLSLLLTGTFPMKNSTRREKCDSRGWWI